MHTSTTAGRLFLLSMVAIAASFFLSGGAPTSAFAQAAPPLDEAGQAPQSPIEPAAPRAAMDSATDTPGAPEATPATLAPKEELLPLVRAARAREASLASVLTARRQIEADLQERQNALRSDSSRGRELEIEREIRALSDELKKLNRNFSELAAGVDPLSIEFEGAPEELNLTREVRDLLGPLVNELKRATSRPREIDRLRTEISESHSQLEQVRAALTRLDRIAQSVTDPEVASAVRLEQRDWTRRQSAISTSLKVSEQKLNQRLGESQSIAQAVENLFQLFFKSRGRNLLLALVAMFGFLFAIRKLRNFLARRPVLSSRSASFEGRVFGLIYSAFTVIGAILVFLISLYFFGDWVLLILVLLLILGLIWTSKQAIPRFWTQTILILDMGVVREGERVVYNGLPWLVESVSFYSTLVNPALVGGQIRLPIDDLSELRSREHGKEEPWFPTKKGDIILLSDGRPAEVEYQSIEGVRLRLPGENRTIIPAAEFAGQALERLSDGYRVDTTFGLDYGDQSEITTRIREIFQTSIDARWRESKWAESLVSTAVEFESASASSLDYFIRVDLDGSTAFDIQAQKRLLARICVDLCNENGWTIPFTQVTLHVAPNEEANT